MLPAILVDADWLVSHADDPSVVIADVRWIPGGSPSDVREAFETGHVPRAVSFDLDRDLSGVPFEDGPGRHPLPSPESFARTLGRVGIGPNTGVVAYDDVRGSVAARLWWMLDAVGVDAALLDGGLQAWWPRPLQDGPGSDRAPVAVPARPWPQGRIVDAAEVALAVERGEVVLDVRAADRFRGEVEPFDPVAGHIPGATSLPWTESIDEATGRFRDAEGLRDGLSHARMVPSASTIVHCGSGVTACFGLFALRLAGLGDARLYEGSWSDWVSDPDRPVAGPER